MRELIVMRHAEAAPQLPDATDFSRVLTERGRGAATSAALDLLQRHGAPDWILYSPAARTSSTAEAVRAALRLDPALLQADPRLYLATPDTLLQSLAEAPEGARRLLLVAHNPAISELAGALRADGSRHSSMATAEYRHFALPIDRWQELREPT